MQDFGHQQYDLDLAPTQPYKPSFATVTGWGGRSKVWFIWQVLWYPTFDPPFYHQVHSVFDRPGAHWKVWFSTRSFSKSLQGCEGALGFPCWFGGMESEFQSNQFKGAVKKSELGGSSQDLDTWWSDHPPFILSHKVRPWMEGVPRPDP